MKLSYRLRSLGRDLRRFPKDLWSVIRRSWWIARGERQRVLEENENLKTMVDLRFKQMTEYRHAAWKLQAGNRLADIDLLREVADEIDCEPGCDDVGLMDASTGVVECPRGDGGDCPFDKACQLRELAAALETHAALKRETAL